MKEPQNIGIDFYAQIGKLERSISALNMMKEDLKGEIDLPAEMDREMDIIGELFIKRQYHTAMERSKALREKLDVSYLKMAKDRAKNPTMDDVEEHLVEIRLFMEELRRKGGEFVHIEKQYETMLLEIEKKNPRGFFEIASKLRRELIYYEDMENLKEYLRPLIGEIKELKDHGVNVGKAVNALKKARSKMKEFNVQEARRLSERVPLMLKGLREVYTEATDKLARVVDKIDLTEKRGINTAPIGRKLINAEKNYREGRYNKAVKIISVLHEEVDTLLREQIWLEENLPGLQEDVEELFTLEPELPNVSRGINELKKEVMNGNVAKAVTLTKGLGDVVRNIRSKYEEISKLLPVAKRRFAAAKEEDLDTSIAKGHFKEASDAMEDGDFDRALKMIKKSIKELLVIQMENS